MGNIAGSISWKNESEIDNLFHKTFLDKIAKKHGLIPNYDISNNCVKRGKDYISYGFDYGGLKLLLTYNVNWYMNRMNLFLQEAKTYFKNKNIKCIVDKPIHHPV